MKFFGTLNIIGMAAGLALIAARAAAQSGLPMTNDELLSGSCGATVRAVHSLGQPGRYLIDLLQPSGRSARSTVLRVDDRNAHWLYAPTTAPQVVIDVPATISGPINVSVAAARSGNGDDVVCRPTIEAPQPPVATPPPNASPLLPVSSVRDDPATCAIPFEKGQIVLPQVSFQLPPDVRGTTGLVKLALVAAPDGSILQIRVLSAPSVQLGAAIADNMRHVSVQPPVFRCVPVESEFFFSAEFHGARAR